MDLHVHACMYVLVVYVQTVLVAASVSSAWRSAQTYKAKLALFSKPIPWINSWVFKMLFITKRQLRAAHTILEEGKVKVKTTTSPIFFCIWIETLLFKKTTTKKCLAQIAVLNTQLQLFLWSSLFINDSAKLIQRSEGCALKPGRLRLYRLLTLGTLQPVLDCEHHLSFKRNNAAYSCGYN